MPTVTQPGIRTDTTSFALTHLGLGVLGSLFKGGLHDPQGREGKRRDCHGQSSCLRPGAAQDVSRAGFQPAKHPA